MPRQARSLQRVSNGRALGEFQGMENTSQRFDESQLGPRHFAFNPDGVHRGDGKILRKSPGETGDAMLFVVQALMGVSCLTVFANGGDALAHAVQALVDCDAVTRLEIAHLAPHVLDHARDLVTQNLGLDAQRDRAAAGIPVIIRTAAIDVQVGPADPHSGGPNQNLVGLQLRHRSIANFQFACVHQDGCPHIPPPPKFLRRRVYSARSPGSQP